MYLSSQKQKETIKQKKMLSTLLGAIIYAEKKHRPVPRKNKNADPYITHPLRVAQLVATLGERGDDTELLIAAILHDVVEDCGVTNAEIKEKFGKRVASIVAEVTDDKSKEKSERKRLQIEHASTISKDAQILKAADKAANLEDMLTHSNGEGIPEEWPVERVQEYAAWALLVVEGLRGAAPKLDAHIDSIIAAGSFSYVDGVTYPIIA